MKWHKAVVDGVLVKDIAQKFNLSLIEASVLVRRGVVHGEDILFFLESDFIYLHNPFCFYDMEVCIDRVKKSFDENEKILVYGDNDVDGITSTTILVKALKTKNATVLWQVPTGEDGYGLSNDTIDDAHSKGVALIITVDCGISNIEECDYANSLGIDMIVLDHHMPSDVLPDAIGIIDAKVEDQQYPFDGLCAAAVASKFSVALAISETSIYNNDIVLLNIEPLNDSYKIEMLCVRNLVKQWDKRMVVSESDAVYQLDELASILDGKQIFLYNKESQLSLIKTIFGNIDFYCMDLQESVDKHFPPLQGKSLLQVANNVRLVKYTAEPMSEINIFFQLYKSVIYAEFPNIKASFYDTSDLVALATIADMMPLVGENRILYNIGIQKMTINPDKNLLCLLDALRVKRDEYLDSKTIGWSIAPVINAAGRMGQANVGVELLLSENTADTYKYAEELIALNKKRKSTMDSLKYAIREEVQKKLEEKAPYIIIYNETLPYNFTGNVAGQYSRQHGIPVVIVAKKENGELNGSIRCPAQYDAPSILKRLQPYLLKGGGHKAAAGFSLLAENKDIFLEGFENILKEGVSSNNDESCVVVDIEIPEAYFVPANIKQAIQKFEPYGEGWSIIHILFNDIGIYSCETVGKGSEHIKLVLNIGKYKVPALLWQYDSTEADLDAFMNATRISFVATVKLGSFQGIEQMSLVLQEWTI